MDESEDMAGPIKKTSLILTATKVAEMQLLCKKTGTTTQLTFGPNSGEWVATVNRYDIQQTARFRGDFVEVISDVIDLLGDSYIYQN